MTGPGVVDPGAIAFDDADDGTTRADTLEAAVTGSHPPVSGNSSLGSYVLDNMAHLADVAKGLFIQTGAGFSDGKLYNIEFHTLEQLHIDLLPYVLSLNRSKPQEATILISQCPPKILCSVLEDKFGPEIAQTGIYEATGLSGVDHVDITTIGIYIPEIQVLANLNGRFINIIQNPYQSIFAMPVEHRAFFSGVIQSTNPVSDDKLGSNHFFCPLGLKPILDYAKKIGEVPKVREYMDAYATIKIL